MTDDAQKVPDRPAMPAAEALDPPVPAGQQEPEPKATGSVAWEAIAPPGKPDGEVDTRPGG